MGKPIPAEALLDRRRRLSVLPPRSIKQRRVMRETAPLYGVSEPTLYRVLRQRLQPRANAMAPKSVEEFPFGGRPVLIYAVGPVPQRPGGCCADAKCRRRSAAC